MYLSIIYLSTLYHPFQKISYLKCLVWNYQEIEKWQSGLKKVWIDVSFSISKFWIKWFNFARTWHKILMNCKIYQIFFSQILFTEKSNNWGVGALSKISNNMLSFRLHSTVSSYHLLARSDIISEFDFLILS